MTTSIKPDGRTVFGVLTWLLPTGQRLTWEGPGARVVLRKPGLKSRSGRESIGTQIRPVSEPCGSLSTAQAVVDAFTDGSE